MYVSNVCYGKSTTSVYDVQNSFFEVPKFALRCSWSNSDHCIEAILQMLPCTLWHTNQRGPKNALKTSPKWRHFFQLGYQWIDVTCYILLIVFRYSRKTNVVSNPTAEHPFQDFPSVSQGKCWDDTLNKALTDTHLIQAWAKDAKVKSELLEFWTMLKIIRSQCSIGVQSLWMICPPY